MMFLAIPPATALSAGTAASPTAILNPALTGLGALRITTFSKDPQPDYIMAEINARVAKKLADSDTRLAALLQIGSNPALTINPPILRINVDRFFLTVDGPSVFRVQTTLFADIPVGINPTIVMNIDFWARSDTIRVLNSNNEVAAVYSLVDKQAAQFVSDFLSANPLPSRPADANHITTPPAPQKKLPALQPGTISQDKTQTQTQYLYVSSKNSKVFHKSSCSLAKSIFPKNIIYYKTRDEAIAAGKRPCKICQP